MCYFLFVFPEKKKERKKEIVFDFEIWRGVGEMIACAEETKRFLLVASSPSG